MLNGVILCILLCFEITQYLGMLVRDVNYPILGLFVVYFFLQNDYLVSTDPQPSDRLNPP